MAINPLDKRSWRDVQRVLRRVSVNQALRWLEGSGIDSHGVLRPSPQLKGRHKAATTLALLAKARRRLPRNLQLHHLRVLDLRGLTLWTLPDVFQYCSQLTHLYLGDNQLKSLPIGIGSSPALQGLFLGRNHLRALPKSVLKLWPTLKQLHLGANHIRRLPFAEDDMPALLRGSIGQNPISEPIGVRWMQAKDAYLAAQRIVECFSVSSIAGALNNDIATIVGQGIDLTRQLNEPMVYEHLFRNMSINDVGAIKWNDHFPESPNNMARFAALSLLPHIVRGSMVDSSLWLQNIRLIDLRGENVVVPADLMAMNGMKLIVRS